ncbi:MAG: PKD domain-containing protein, partial [Thermoplasmata archaeon]|nr:PKD domain-containing protein [Thermoplasmata archaeon]
MGIDERIKVILPIIILVLAGSSMFSHTPGAEAVLDSNIYMALYPTESMDLVEESTGPGVIYLKNHSGYDWAMFDIDDIVGRPAGNDHASISLSAYNHGSAKATLEIYISFFMDPDEASDSQAWFPPVEILPDGSEDINVDSDVIQGDLPVMSPGKVRLYIRQVETTYADIRITLDEFCFITIPYLPDQPVANAGEDRTEYRDQVVMFDGSGSYQTQGEEMEYSWDFNAANGIINEASGITVAHLFEIPGTYTVTLSVFLGALFDSDTLTVIVEEDTPPVLTIGGNVNSFKNTLISLSIVECYDPEGEDVNITWDMGDGTLLYGRSVEHVYSNDGIYLVNVSATDSRNYNNRSLTAYIRNRAPTADILVDSKIVSGFPIQFRAINVVDLEGDSVEYFRWEFG